MDRREFVRLTALGSGLSIVAPKLVLAGLPESPLAGSVYYTKDAPGRWSAKVQTHLPQLEVQKDTTALSIQVVTPHEMKGYEHYIVKHILLDSKFGFLEEKLFSPATDKSPISKFSVKSDYKGSLYALSMCNLHDVWLNVIEI